MGQVIIDVPQNVNIKTTIESVEVADEILEIIERRKKLETIKPNITNEFEDVESFEKKTKSEKTPAILPPRRNNLIEDGDAVLGIWSDDERMADEIARKIREKNRKVT